MIEQIKNNIKNCLEDFYKEKYSLGANVIIEEPKNSSMGDIAVPAFFAVKALKKPLQEVTNEIAEVIRKSNQYVRDIKITGPFVNIILDKQKLSSRIVRCIIDENSSYADSKIGENQCVVIDYSSPNIAKSFSIGHLRSTMIGNSIKLIYKKCGYKAIGINYLGDWGTQFGKMIVAYKKWGNKEVILADPINELSKLYVKFHQEQENDASLEDEARDAFRKMELGDKEYIDLWKWIRDESLKESKQIYDLLEVNNFDSYNGEAYYNDKMEPVVIELEQKGLLKEDQGAMVVDMGEGNPPALIKRSDGGSLYITRDLAAIFDRKKVYNFNKALYVVGNEQKLHFEQLKTIITKMGYDFADEIEHVNFGLYLKDGKKMSTRRGNVVKLYDILMKSIKLAYNLISEKNPGLENKDEIAKYVGIAAIVFGDLKNHRSLDVEFDLEQSVKFEGQTGPYLQYTGVRIASILRNQIIDVEKIDESLFEKPHYFELIKLLGSFKSIIEKACAENAPSFIAKYLLSLAQSFNRFYSIEKINVEDDKIRNTNFALSKAVRVVLDEGLRLLGIHSLEQM